MGRTSLLGYSGNAMYTSVLALAVTPVTASACEETAKTMMAWLASLTVVTRAVCSAKIFGERESRSAWLAFVTTLRELASAVVTTQPVMQFQVSARRASASAVKVKQMTASSAIR